MFKPNFFSCYTLVIRQNGAVPIRYGILANVQDNAYDVKTRLSALTETEDSPPIDPDHFVMVQCHNFRITGILNNSDRVKAVFNQHRPVYAFQITPPTDELQPVNELDPTDQQIQKILTSSKNSHLRPPTAENGSRPAHSRQSSFSGSTGSMIAATSISNLDSPAQDNVILVVHLKMMRQDSYFIASQKSRPALFGLPLVVPYHENMTHLELYKKVWALVARLVSPLPPADGINSYNHAQDW